MSWGDQILDELGIGKDENWRQRFDINDTKMLLFLFALWLAKKRGEEAGAEGVEAEVNEFLKAIGYKDNQ